MESSSRRGTWSQVYKVNQRLVLLSITYVDSNQGGGPHCSTLRYFTILDACSSGENRQTHTNLHGVFQCVGTPCFSSFKLSKTE